MQLVMRGITYDLLHPPKGCLLLQNAVIDSQSAECHATSAIALSYVRKSDSSLDYITVAKLFSHH